MAAITISNNERTLARDGKPFFWLADTCWSAFTSITDEDWEAYLDLRASQGFNVLQINALPQWDRSGCAFDRFPFATSDHGRSFDFSSLDEGYFEHARWMCSRAAERGFSLAIVVMWCSYVPGTWACERAPWLCISSEQVPAIVEKITSSFNEFEPIYVISGDTDWEDARAVERYLEVTRLVEQGAPGACLAYHIKGRYDVLPEELASHADIYLYQSGHNRDAQAMAYELAASFLGRDDRKPVINSEPCYEQMGFSHLLYGRFRRQECRCALWRSLLAGASAGITYGAHGVWNWQDDSFPSTHEFGEGFLQGPSHDRAILLPGAADFGFARRLADELSRRAGAFELVPCQELVVSYEPDVRAARLASEKGGEATLLVYVPTNAPIRLLGDLSSAPACCIDLATHERYDLETTFDAASGVTTVRQGEHLEDALLVLKLRTNL